MPEFELFNSEYIIFSHAFINTINFLENEKIRIDFIADKNVLIDRFKKRENIIKNDFDNNIDIYYKSYEEVLKESESKLLNASCKNIIEKLMI